MTSKQLKHLRQLATEQRDRGVYLKTIAEGFNRAGHRTATGRPWTSGNISHLISGKITLRKSKGRPPKKLARRSQLAQRVQAAPGASTITLPAQPKEHWEMVFIITNLVWATVLGVFLVNYVKL